MKQFFILIMTLMPFVLFAQTAEYKCDFEGVAATPIKVFPEDSNSPEFSYRYQLYGKLNPDELAIIYLPGGPGSSSIKEVDALKKSINSSGLPDQTPIIFIDPRTVGCNRGSEEIFPDESLTSVHHAQDVLTVIQHLKLRKYILYGHSYGTQVATFIGAMAEARSIPLPNAVFLSGVLGKGKADGTFGIPFQKSLEWELLKTKLPASTVKMLSETMPLGIDQKIWGSYISSELKSGASYSQSRGKLVNFLLEDLLSYKEDEPETHQSLLKIVTQPYQRSPGTRDWSERLFRKIDCHEYSPKDGESIFLNGTFIFDEQSDPCRDDPFDRPYDSADLQLKSPVYYVIGTNDYAAPFEGALYHFEHQKDSVRNAVIIPGGGHNPLGSVLPKCAPEIWKAVFAQEDLENILPKCQAEVEYRKLNIGE